MGYRSVACAVIHQEPPQVLLAENIEVLHRVLALEVVARADPTRLDPGARDEMRAALLDERWDDAVLAWIGLTGIYVDVYSNHQLFADDDLPADLIGAQLQFTRLFQG